MIARASRQLNLLSIEPRYRITKNAQARNAYGACAQEIVCNALRLDPIPVNGTCTVCFDAESNGHFYEIKSVKKSGRLIIYDWRMTKEKAANVPLAYAVLCHQVTNSDGTDLLQSMLASGLELLVAPAFVVHDLAIAQPLKKLRAFSSHPRNGYARHGYRNGYRELPVKTLKQALTYRQTIHSTIYERAFELPVFLP